MPIPGVGTGVPATYVVVPEMGKEVSQRKREALRSVGGVLVSLTTGEAQVLHGVPSPSKPSRFISLHYKPNIVIFLALEIVDKTLPV